MVPTEMIVLPVLFGMIGFIFWVIADAWQRRTQMKMMTDFNSRLLDRLGSVKDFNDLLQTDGGARLIGALTAERGSTGARERILRATQIGVVCVALGGGFLTLAGRFEPYDNDVLTIFGVIGLSLGIGLLLSAAAAFFVARSLGVLDKTDAYGNVRPPVA